MADYLTPDKAVAEFNLPGVGWLARKRSSGGGPRYSKVGRRILYSRAAIVEWLEENARANTADEPSRRARAARRRRRSA